MTYFIRITGQEPQEQTSFEDMIETLKQMSIGDHTDFSAVIEDYTLIEELTPMLLNSEIALYSVVDKKQRINFFVSVYGES